jgi:hypothetical protein
VNNLDKFKWIQEHLPYNYVLLVRTNNCENTFGKGKWFINFSHEEGFHTDNHKVEQLYKTYTDDLDMALDYIILLGETKGLWNAENCL